MGLFNPAELVGRLLSGLQVFFGALRNARAYAVSVGGRERPAARPPGRSQGLRVMPRVARRVSLPPATKSQIITRSPHNHPVRQSDDFGRPGFEPRYRSERYRGSRLMPVLPDHSG